ncbi:MAG: hypothetical protein COB02_06465 [Candidatus Cloacimonadota bacterium]|nr:MAG: hypothetical protein COB02_06465 [Candidatus Cloacimonadota bacterium]
MKREIPLMITFLTCSILLLQFILDFPILNKMAISINDSTSIVATFAMVLGLASLASVHINKIYRKRRDWGYSIILMFGFLVTLYLGFLYGVDKDYTTNISKAQYEAFSLENSKFIKKGEKERHSLSIQTNFYFTRNTEKVLITKDIYKQLKSENISTIEEKTYRISNQNKLFYTLIFENIYDPLQATMFSLLAFFMASAAFRAFRAKSLEASLLLISAFLVMMGRVPIGEMLGSLFGFDALFPEMSNFIMNVFNTAGQRAIMIGATLGMIASSFRMWIGLETEHLGRD